MPEKYKWLRWLVLAVLVPAAGIFVLAITLRGNETALFIFGPVWLFVYSLLAISHGFSGYSRLASIKPTDYSIIIWNVCRTRKGRFYILLGWSKSLAWLFFAPVIGCALLINGICEKGIQANGVFIPPLFLVTCGTILLLTSTLVWFVRKRLTTPTSPLSSMPVILS